MLRNKGGSPSRGGGIAANQGFGFVQPPVEAHAILRRPSACLSNLFRAAPHKSRTACSGDVRLTPDEISVIRERYHGWEKAGAKTLAAVFGVSVQRIIAVAGRRG